MYSFQWQRDLQSENTSKTVTEYDTTSSWQYLSLHYYRCITFPENDLGPHQAIPMQHRSTWLCCKLWETQSDIEGCCFNVRYRLCSKECSKQSVTYDCCFTLLQTEWKSSNVTEFQLTNLCFIIFPRLHETEFLLGKLYFANCRTATVRVFLCVTPSTFYTACPCSWYSVKLTVLCLQA